VTRVWISIDMEGIGGVAAYSHVMQKGVEYERARTWMVQEANACIEGALAAGAEQICVNDSHGQMHNLFADELDPRAELISGSGKPWSMGQGIDGGFDTCFLIGYHGRAGHPKAVLDHTFSPWNVFECRLNGEPVGETTLIANLAGYFGPTVSLVAGDGATLAEARALVPDVVTVQTKEATGRFSARLLHPQRVREALRDGARRAVAIAGNLDPVRVKGDADIELTFVTSTMADFAELMPGSRRSGARSVAYCSGDYLEAYKAMLVMVRLAPAAIPPEQ
jgi:D-amino peptidase